jgi:hypothetical protein
LEDEILTTKQKQWDLEAKVALYVHFNLFIVRHIFWNVFHHYRHENSKRDWQKEKDDLVTKLAHRDEQLEKIHAELNAFKDQLAQCNKEKAEALIKAEELNSQQLTLEYKYGNIIGSNVLSDHPMQYLYQGETIEWGQRPFGPSAGILSRWAWQTHQGSAQHPTGIDQQTVGVADGTSGENGRGIQFQCFRDGQALDNAVSAGVSSAEICDGTDRSESGFKKSHRPIDWRVEETRRKCNENSREQSVMTKSCQNFHLIFIHCHSFQARTPFPDETLWTLQNFQRRSPVQSRWID